MLTASELQISDDEYRALQIVREKLLAGKFQHVKEFGSGVAPDYKGKAFNMGCPMDANGTRRGCGQVGCIGGWMGIEMGMTVQESDSYVRRRETHPTLGDLFYPIAHNLNSLTDKEAGHAIGNFLESGDGAQAWAKARGCWGDDGGEYEGE